MGICNCTVGQNWGEESPYKHQKPWLLSRPPHHSSISWKWELDWQPFLPSIEWGKSICSPVCSTLHELHGESKADFIPCSGTQQLCLFSGDGANYSTFSKGFSALCLPWLFTRVVFFHIREELRLDIFRGSLDEEFSSNNHLLKITKVSQ